MNNTINSFNFLKKKYLLSISFIIITVIILFPYIYWGQDVKIPIYDNLNSNVVWIKMVIDAGGPYLHPTAIIDQPMNGLPLASVYGMYDFSMIWFYIFDSFWGYIVNKYLVALIAFFGMYFLLKKHFLPKDSPIYIAVGTALLFGILPFWSFGTHVAGIPMAFCAFLNLRDMDKRWINWVALLLQAFYSSLVLSGVFLLVIVSFILLIDTIKTKKINRYFLGGIVFMSIAYIISHLPMIVTFLSPDFISHRTERMPLGSNSVNKIYSDLSIFWLGYPDHAPGFQQYIMIPILLTIIPMIGKRKISKKYLYVLSYILFAVIWITFGIPFFEKYFREIISFDTSRFSWMIPACWYLLLGISLCYISKYIKKWGIWISAFILCFQFVYLCSQQQFITSRYLPSYNRYYAKTLFDDVICFIGKEQKSYRILTIGAHSAVTQYNGFYTIDGFSNAYPLEYKHKFQKIITKEIEKSEDIQTWFTNWGSTCYGFSADLYIYPQDFALPPIENLEYDYDQLKSMGGEYIISATIINTNNNPRVKLLKAFDNFEEVSHWKIYLYKVL